MASRLPINERQIANLRHLLRNTNAQLVTPDETEAYINSIRRWSRAAEKPAGACLIPKSNEAISITLKFASENDLDVSVKGGGHSTAGASSTDGGTCIDLNTHMRSTHVDVNKQTIAVAGGATWGEVDAALAPHGLAVVGGTVADTGVGGLTLGGGFGWLTVKHGLVVDHLLECTVVLANGSVVKSSEKENPDLFWGLRGAGQNFGVITEFVFRAHKQEEMWAGLNLFPPTDEIIGKVIEIANTLFTPSEDGTSKASYKAAGAVGLVRPPPSGEQTLLMVGLMYDGPEEQGKEFFKDILALGPLVSTMAMVTYENANKLLSPPIGLRSSMKGASFELPVRTEFVLSIRDKYRKFTEELPDAAGSAVLFELVDPAKIVQVSNSAMAYANRGLHLNAVVQPLWSDKANDEKCRAWAREMAQMYKKELQRHGSETGTASDGFIGKRGEHGATMVYGNYDQYDEKARDVYGNNYERLQELKSKYDPQNVFDKLFPIQPKSSTS